MGKLNDSKRVLIQALLDKFGPVVTRKQILEFVKGSGTEFEGSRVPTGVEFPHWITNNKEIRTGSRGQYNLALFDLTVPVATPKKEKVAKSPKTPKAKKVKVSPETSVSEEAPVLSN